MINDFNVEWKTGSSNKNASWPLSVIISAKLTFVCDLLRYLIIVFVSDVGNNQSDEKFLFLRSQKKK